MAAQSTSTVSIPSIGLVPLLTTLFVGLKLTGHINWSWWWVLSPVWITALIAILIMVLFVVVSVYLDGGR